MFQTGSVTSEYSSSAFHIGQSTSLHNSRDVGRTIERSPTHIDSLTSVSVALSSCSIKALLSGVVTITQVTVRFRLPPPQVLVHSLHSLVFHLRPICGLQQNYSMI